MEDITIDDIIAAMPPNLAQGLRDAQKRQDEFIAKHGREAWDNHIANMKRKEMEEYDARIQKERSLAALEKSEMREAVAEYTFDRFLVKDEWQRRMKQMCMDFLEQSDSRFFYLSGQNGAGKTHLATAICGQMIERGYSTRYEIHPNMMIDLKANVNDEDYAETLAKYTKPKVLYIDDFFKNGSENGQRVRPTASDIKHSFNVINMRYVRNNWTIITSEWSIDEVIRMDEALGSRIKQKCGRYMMDIDRRQGRNYRMNATE